MHIEMEACMGDNNCKSGVSLDQQKDIKGISSKPGRIPALIESYLGAPAHAACTDERPGIGIS
ncbi:hypothetical protein DCC81_18990 [Chitinophaga parva]|uniref:Uncharacterized protein n=1 Tax=Chitinophaga parva TaxID=2169414 RepID=A0A2T7BJ41_9BACT|nr:hypothetical protein DCC81_18990 [Chitinophaga parva]